jgi:hypothetical protein
VQIPDAPSPGFTTLYVENISDTWSDTADENPSGPEITNIAVGSEYSGVSAADLDPTHPDWYREHSTATDGVDIELDLASVGDYAWSSVTVCGST